MMEVAAFASGGLAGFVPGLIGGGGPVLAVPLLVYAVGVENPHVAIGTGAVAVAVSAFASLMHHARAHNVKWLCAGVFASMGVLGALLGSSLGKSFDGQKLLFFFRAAHDPYCCFDGRKKENCGERQH